MKTPLLGSAYESRSLRLNAQRMVNLYPELVETRDGKEIGGLYGCPGLLPLVTVGNGPVRGFCTSPDRTKLYAVSGSRLYEINHTWSAVELGTLASSTGMVSMARNATQAMLVDGYRGYVYTFSSGAFLEVTDPDFTGADQVAFIDQYFAFNKSATGQWGITALGDGTSIDALDITTSEGAPDNLLGILVDHREVWTPGTESIEIYVPNPASDFPFERSQMIEVGVASAFSMVKLDNSVFWVDASDKGDASVRRADGYTPRIVSTYWVSRILEGLSGRDDLQAFGYQQEKHSFYVLTSPSGGVTLVYDASTDLWHERAYRNPETNTLERYRANCHIYFNNRHVVGDFETGTIYALDLDTFTDNGSPRKWLRTWRLLPEGPNPRNTVFVDALRIDCEKGVGLQTGQGEDAQMMLRLSRDGGRTFGREMVRSMGPAGEYSREVIFGPLSSGGDPVAELSGTDPVKVALVGAHIDGELEP